MIMVLDVTKYILYLQVEREKGQSKTILSPASKLYLRKQQFKQNKLVKKKKKQEQQGKNIFLPIHDSVLT